MQSEQTQKYTRTAKTAATRRPAKKKVNPVLKNVVSLRVSDQEKLLLDQLTATTSLNVSDLVREALGFWLSKRQGRRAAKIFKQAFKMDS